MVCIRLAMESVRERSHRSGVVEIVERRSHPSDTRVGLHIPIGESAIALATDQEAQFVIILLCKTNAIGWEDWLGHDICRLPKAK